MGVLPTQEIAFRWHWIDGHPPDWPEIVGARGLLRQVEHAGFTLSKATTLDDLEAIFERYDPADWVGAAWLDELAHVGQIGRVTAAWRGVMFAMIPIQAVVQLRFNDGYEEQFFISDVQFD